MKQASAYLRNGRVFLKPISRTTKGFLISCDPLVICDEGDAELGRKVLWALSQSTVDIPHPESWIGFCDDLVKAAGVRSYMAFANLAKYIIFAQNDDEVVITPTKNGGPRKGFLDLKTKKIRCQPAEEELTQALKDAFDACE